MCTISVLCICTRTVLRRLKVHHCISFLPGGLSRSIVGCFLHKYLRTGPEVVHVTLQFWISASSVPFVSTDLCVPWSSSGIPLHPPAYMLVFLSARLCIRIRSLSKSPPPLSWDGVTIRDDRTSLEGPIRFLEDEKGAFLLRYFFNEPRVARTSGGAYRPSTRPRSDEGGGFGKDKNKGLDVQHESPPPRYNSAEFFHLDQWRLDPICSSSAEVVRYFQVHCNEEQRQERPTLYPSESSSTHVGSVVERKIPDEGHVTERQDTSRRLGALRNLMRQHELDY